MRAARSPVFTAWSAAQGGGAVPSAPSQVTSITADAAATVSWVNPGSGPAATSYTVTPYIAGAAQATTTVAAPAASAAVTGLTNATAYTFSVHASNGAGASSESAQSGANTPRVNLIFGDEFNGSSLDPAWSVLSRDGDQSGAELQYYLPGQVSLDGAGNLVIHAQALGVTAPGYDDANGPTYAGSNVTRSYRSGAVQWASFKYTFGKVQVSAKCPNGANLWPAIWMIGSNCQATNPLDPDNVATCNWAQPGSEEVDIAEYPGSFTSYNAQLWTGGGTPSGGSIAAPANFSTAYHTYEMDWASGTMSWLLDGVTGPVDTTSIPSTPMFLIMQTAIRGTPVFTQPDMIIDWVRVFHN
jgi:beta-glucanase (GH16 family)